MSLTLHLAIDLGTSHFRSGLAGSEDIFTEPCAVARDKYGKLTVVGEEAERMVGRHPESMEILHPVQGGAIKDYEGTVAVLKYIVNRLLPRKFARRFDLTLAVPSRLTSVERRALEEAAKEAGARQIRLFDTLVAAAIGADLAIAEPIGCLLISMGAGITEIALTSLGGIVDSRRLSIGGGTVDEEIMDWVRKERAFLIGKHTAEQLKRGTGGSDGSTNLPLKGRSLATGLPEQIEIPNTVVKDLLGRYYETIVGLIVQTMEFCPPELVGDIMDHGIVLVGGCANDVHVLESLTQKTEVPIIVADSPETCVIRGLMKSIRGVATTSTPIRTITPENRSPETPPSWRNRFIGRLRNL
jgi:rod shape-determining protein MreB and related proteins